MCLCVFLCVRARVYVCMCVRVCVRPCVRLCVCVREGGACVRAYMRLCVCSGASGSTQFSVVRGLLLDLLISYVLFQMLYVAKTQTNKQISVSVI